MKKFNTKDDKEAIEYFKENRYSYIENFFNKEDLQEANDSIASSLDGRGVIIDNMCPKSLSFNGRQFDKFLHSKKDIVERISGKRLIPTYSYARLYKNGEKLYKHIDRPSCEISITCTISYKGSLWPFCLLDKTSSAENLGYYLMESNGKDRLSRFIDEYDKLSFDILPGDAILYRGTELIHWREQYNGQEQAQVFFHYVDADGPYRDFKT